MASLSSPGVQHAEGVVLDKGVIVRVHGDALRDPARERVQINVLEEDRRRDIGPGQGHQWSCYREDSVVVVSVVTPLSTMQAFWSEMPEPLPAL